MLLAKQRLPSAKRRSPNAVCQSLLPKPFAKKASHSTCTKYLDKNVDEIDSRSQSYQLFLHKMKIFSVFFCYKAWPFSREGIIFVCYRHSSLTVKIWKGIKQSLVGLTPSLLFSRINSGSSKIRSSYRVAVFSGRHRLLRRRGQRQSECLHRRAVDFLSNDSCLQNCRWVWVRHWNYDPGHIIKLMTSIASNIQLDLDGEKTGTNIRVAIWSFLKQFSRNKKIWRFLVLDENGNVLGLSG